MNTVIQNIISIFFFGRNELLDKLHPKAHETICEYECGTARNLIYIAKNFQNSKFIGVDASTQILEIAKRKIKKANLSNQIRLVHGVAGSFKFQEKIDRIIFSYSLSMLNKPREILEDCLAQMPPGGSIEIVDFGDFKLWPAIFKSPTLRFLNLLGFFPKVEFLKEFEIDKNITINYNIKLGGYSYMATIKRSGI